MRSRARRSAGPAIVAVAATWLATGCTGTAAHSVGMLCEPPGGHLETGIVLMAQAVPSATFVPCVHLYPAGWTFASLQTERGRATITFDSDRGGAAALTVTFTRACRPQGTVVPPDVLGANGLRVRNERVRQLDKDFGPSYRATRFYTFNGGCMIFELRLTPGTQSGLTTDAAVMVNLLPRHTIAAQVEDAGFSL